MFAFCFKIERSGCLYVGNHFNDLHVLYSNNNSNIIIKVIIVIVIIINNSTNCIININSSNINTLIINNDTILYLFQPTDKVTRRQC